MTDQEEETLIPIIVKHSESSEGIRGQDNSLDQNCDLNHCKANDREGYGCLQQSSEQPLPTGYGWYPQLPPTINIFACPPPPPPYNPTGRHVYLKPSHTQGRVTTEHLHTNAFSVAVQSNKPFDNSGLTSSAGTTTPPPPELTTPFNCDDAKTESNTTPAHSDEYDYSGFSGCSKMNTPNYNLHLGQKGKSSRFHPYQHDHRLTQIKKEPELEPPKKHFVSVDTQDFDPSEISIKLKEKTLTIEGNKSTNALNGKFSRMKHEFTFNNRQEAENTSCTYHSGGKLILQLNYDSDSHDDKIQSSQRSQNS